jgi:hypothetical protein
MTDHPEEDDLRFADRSLAEAKARKAAAQRKWREANKERTRAYDQQYNAERRDPEQVQEYNHAYWRDNRGTLADKRRQPEAVQREKEQAAELKQRRQGEIAAKQAAAKARAAALREQQAAALREQIDPALLRIGQNQ